ncbi:TNFAIP3-interacting protein 1-like [Asterias rubens]|uniref:TNFAIP3-interacting protein 1-like n=1 Tax=Asterias rubens TaxID=7604 RepID=UPI0014558E72|nr:TNFAIP3-interacting protein 1-like [Asterias rubens]
MARASAEKPVGVIMASSFKGPPEQPLGDNNDDDNNKDDKHELSSSIGAISEDFEYVIPGYLISERPSHDHQIKADRPEISMQIRNVEHALQSLVEDERTSEITAHLSELVPKIIRLERTVKMQTTLRTVFEEENHNLKSEAEERKQEINELREEMRQLEEEISEMRKAKEEEQCGGFDFVTTKEAREIKDAQKQKTVIQQPVTAATTGVSEEVHFMLQRKYQSLKKQMEEIVKVNHSWDEHYHNMKTQMQNQIEDLQRKLTDAKNMGESNGDPQTNIGLDKVEKEKAEAVAEVVALKQKCDKLERYARTLTGQRKEMDKEIQRLNEALSQNLRIGKEQSGKLQSENHTAQIAPLPSSSSEVNKRRESPIHVKGVNEMTEGELKEELELLRQQTEVFQSDFFNERQDRQRVMGELDALQKELRRAKKQIQQQDTYVQGEQRLYYQPNRPYSTSAPQPRYNQVSAPPRAGYAIPTRRHDVPPGRLIAHGRGSYVYNTAGNDVYIDGIGEDGNQPESLESNPNGAQDNMLVCPRCERGFDDDSSYHFHISECMNA